MPTDIVNFTPWSALAGGALIGLAATLFLLANGRIAGISGVLHGAVRQAEGRGWRLLFMAGLLAGTGLYVALFPGDLEPREGYPMWLLIVAGLLVGVTWAGHAVVSTRVERVEEEGAEEASDSGGGEEEDDAAAVVRARHARRRRRSTRARRRR